MKLLPVSKDSFPYIFSLAGAAMDNRIPPGVLPRLVGKTIEVEVEPGQKKQVTFQDKAVVRMMEAVASEVQEAPQRIATAGRLYFLYDMLERQEAAPWLRRRASERMVHPAMLAVAATHAVDSETGFEAGFFEAVRRVAEGMEVVEPT